MDSKVLVYKMAKHFISMFTKDYKYKGRLIFINIYNVCFF